MSHQRKNEFFILTEDVLDGPVITDSRNLPAFKHDLLKKISQAAREHECFAEDAYKANGEIDIGLEQFEPLTHFLNKKWDEDRFKDLEADWTYLGKKRWDLLLGGPVDKLIKHRLSSENGKSAKDSKVAPDFRKVRVYVTIEDGLVPENRDWELSFIQKSEIPNHEDLPENNMGQPGRGCAVM